VSRALVLGGRRADALGLLNQRLAATADYVHLVVAGLPLRLT
jgi:adenosyl cobinamide kinase/adenosyl cobinamide phosphate guanylyltransferase